MKTFEGVDWRTWPAIALIRLLWDSFENRLQRGKGGRSEIKQEATAVNQDGDSGGLGMWIMRQEKWSNCGYKLKAEQRRVLDRLDF